MQGTVHQLLDFTGWRGSEVLYFGDHPYSDLADVTLEHGWCTGAIISELTVSKPNLLSELREGSLGRLVNVQRKNDLCIEKLNIKILA